MNAEQQGTAGQVLLVMTCTAHKLWTQGIGSYITICLYLHCAALLSGSAVCQGKKEKVTLSDD